MQEIILTDLSQADYFSLAIYESTNNTDVAQIHVFMGYFDVKDFKEELLSLIPLKGHIIRGTYYSPNWKSCLSCIHCHFIK